MTKSNDSLGGKNTTMRSRSPRSSRGHSANFKKLRKLDREITKIDRLLKFYYLTDKQNMMKRRQELDDKRKAVRHILKTVKPI